MPANCVSLAFSAARSYAWKRLALIMRRYENRSTFMTSNRPIEEWGKLLNDVPAATAILDRFLHHAEIISMKGRSYRLRNGGRSPGPGEEPNSGFAPGPNRNKKRDFRLCRGLRRANPKTPSRIPLGR